MPQQTKSSISTKVRLSKAAQVTLASAGKKSFTCDIDGCKAVFRNQTDLSRHKWVHLPLQLRPTCPFNGHYGYRCSEPYTGRAEQIKTHWIKEHPEAGPYPIVKWPRLNEILVQNNLRLGQNNPRIFTPRTSHSPSPAPSLELVPDASSAAEDYFNVPWSLDQHHPQLAHGYIPQLVPFHANPQEVFQPATPSFSPNFPAALPPQHQYMAAPVHPPQHQYMAAPVHPAFVNAAHSTVSGQYDTFNMQVEHMQFDLSLGYSQPNLTDAQWNAYSTRFLEGTL